MISANYKNLLSPNETKALNKFINYLKSYFQHNLLEVKIFGSKVRGEAKNDSDIDIYILLKNINYKITHDISDFASEVSLDFNIIISPVIFSLEEEKKNRYFGTLFITLLDTEGITLYGAK